LCAAAAASTGCAQFRNPISQFAGQRRQHADAQRQVARLQEHQGNLAKAESLYADLLQRDPNNSELHQRLGVIASRQGDSERAIAYFQKAARLAPQNPDLLADYGYALYLAGDLHAAEKSFRQALAESGRNERALNNLALVLGDQQRFDEAYNVFRQTVGEASAHANVAYLYAQNGFGEKAIEHYTRALELDSELQAAQNGLLQLARQKQRLDATRSQQIAGAGANAEPTRPDAQVQFDDQAAGPYVAGALAARRQAGASGRSNPNRQPARSAGRSPFEADSRPSAEPVSAPVATATMQPADLSPFAPEPQPGNQHPGRRVTQAQFDPSTQPVGRHNVAAPPEEAFSSGTARVTDGTR
jgi:tetratricopeptide (TPR) repeat protein